MADDIIEPPVPEGDDDGDFETLESSGAIDTPEVPAGETPPVRQPVDVDPNAPVKPEWAKGGKPLIPDPGEQPPAKSQTPEDKAAAAAASAAGRTLAGRKQSIQQEIDAETWRRHEAKRQADAEEGRLQQLRAQREALSQPPARQPAPDPAAAQPQAEPQLEQFENYELYSRAWGHWAKGEAVREARAMFAEESARQQAHVQQTAAQQEQSRLESAHAAKINTFRAATPDYDAVVAAAANLPTNPMMDTHFVQSPDSAPLMYYLATHADECARIASLAPGPTLVALGRLEERLTAAPSGPALKAPPRTHARPPIKPVGSGPLGVDGEPPGEDDDLDAHAEYYNKRDRDATARR